MRLQLPRSQAESLGKLGNPELVGISTSLGQHELKSLTIQYLCSL
jgi:hypothetical protein